MFWNARGLTASEVEQARLNGDENELARLLGTADAVWEERLRGVDEAYNLAHGPASMSLEHSDDVRGVDAKQSRWDRVQEGFLRFYVSMLMDYLKFMPTMPTGTNDATWGGPGAADDGRFQAQEFLDSQLPEFQPFQKELLGTQQFDDFVTRRMYNAGDAPDIRFFDQSIDAKRNRSKLTLKKKDVPFLRSAMAHRQMKQVDAIPPNRKIVPSESMDYEKGQFAYPVWPERFDESLFAKPRPIPKIITAEFDRRSALTAMLRDKHGIAKGGRLPGSNNPSPEATAFVLFFITFSNTIGKDLTSLEKEHTTTEESTDQCTDVESTSSDADGPWKPKVNPPWMDGEFFQTLHSTFRPLQEETVFDDSLNHLCPPDWADICGGKMEKIIDPATYLGTPWLRHNVAAPIKPDALSYVRSPSKEKREIEIEKAGQITKAQINMGYNTVSFLIIFLPSANVTVLQQSSIFYVHKVENDAHEKVDKRTNHLQIFDGGVWKMWNCAQGAPVDGNDDAGGDGFGFRGLLCLHKSYIKFRK